MLKVFAVFCSHSAHLAIRSSSDIFDVKKSVEICQIICLTANERKSWLNMLKKWKLKIDSHYLYKQSCRTLSRVDRPWNNRIPMQYSVFNLDFWLVMKSSFFFPGTSFYTPSLTSKINCIKSSGNREFFQLTNNIISLY